MGFSSVLKVAFVAIVFLTATPHSSESYGLFSGLNINGGTDCMVCPFLTGLGRNIMQVKNMNSSQAIDYFISCFPEPYLTALRLIEPIILDAFCGPIDSNVTADVACYAAGFCYVDTEYHYCHLYDLPEDGMTEAVRKIREEFDITSITDKCSIPEFAELCELLHLTDPVVIEDPDGDNFTTHPTMRGYAWRGQDCAEDNSDIYPGRLPINSDRDFDSNCNGIWGVNPDTGNAYEDELCGDQSNYGIIYIGDSIGAHFHIPPDWFRANVVDADLMTNLTFIIGNELDWPHMSWGTGFVNSTWPVVVQSPTNSLYWRLRNRNLCNHRDYQNLAFNGGSSVNAMDGVKTISRDNSRDKPAIVFYAQFGNDICGSDTGAVDEMTPVDEFRAGVIEALDYLEPRLPAKSHVFLVGLVNGTYLYNILKDHLHPIGEINGDITYTNVYNYFGCMQTVCPGWTNTNATVQRAATDHAMLLTSVLQEIAATVAYTNFQLHFLPSPLEEAVALWTGEPWELIELVDGLHPSKNGQDMFAEVAWQVLTSEFADVLGPVNPNNDMIVQLFSDQGGH